MHKYETLYLLPIDVATVILYTKSAKAQTSRQRKARVIRLFIYLFMYQNIIIFLTMIMHATYLLIDMDRYLALAVHVRFETAFIVKML